PHQPRIWSYGYISIPTTAQDGRAPARLRCHGRGGPRRCGDGVGRGEGIDLMGLHRKGIQVARFHELLASEQRSAALYTRLARAVMGEQQNVLAVLPFLERAEHVDAGRYRGDADATAAMAIDERCTPACSPICENRIRRMTHAAFDAVSVGTGEIDQGRCARQCLASTTDWSRTPRL